MTTILTVLALLLFQDVKQDLSLNWIIIGVLLFIAAVLGVIVVKRRMREQRDDEYDH